MSKEKRTGFILKISLIILALLGSFLIMVTFVLLYWQNLKLSNEQESLKEEIAKLEREISKLKKN
jgi:cell division protein FtsB